MVRRIPSHIYFQNQNRNRHDAPLTDHEINPLVTQVSTAQGTYIALIFSTSISSISWDYKDQFLIFRVVDGNPVLLPNPMPTFRMGFDLGFVDDPTPFADRNANGQLELALSDRVSMGSSTCYTNHNLALLEIRPDGSVENITPMTTGRFYISHLEDIDGDGIPEIAANASATNLYDSSKCSYRTIQWFGWNGARYENISATLDESFYPTIAEFWVAFEEIDCISIDDSLYEMLWDEYARGNLQNVWNDIKANYPMCPANPSTFEQLGNWVNEFLPEGDQ
jgi:hypothetical protein